MFAKRLSTELFRATASRLGMAACALALFTGVLATASHSSRADKVNLASPAESAHRKDQTVVLTIGMADIVDVDGAVSDIMVADPGVVDVMVLQSNRLYMVGSQIGTTNVIAVDAEGNIVRRMNVRVKIDDGAIADMVRDLFPDEDVKITTMGQQVVLTGHVSTPDVSNRLANVVSRFVAQARGTPNAGGGVDSNILNMLTVAGEQQVMLRVKIVEASRDVLRELGISTNATETEPGGMFRNIFGNIAGTIGNGLTAEPMGTGSIIYNKAGGSIGPINVAIRALEQDGLLNTLAEPNLTAISGQEAGFLAGGEFPVPTGRDQDGNIVIDYRPFGVTLNFRPAVMSNDRISLQLRTEVSAISNQNSINVNQVSIPGFTVRRAQTTVEMASGGSLMIAGLLRSDATKTMTDLPGIKNVPILGKLISSESFQREESELVVIVTPYLVSPYGDKAQANEVMAPERNPLAAAFETNIRRVYSRRPLEEALFDGRTAFGYLID